MFSKPFTPEGGESTLPGASHYSKVRNLQNNQIKIDKKRPLFQVGN